MTAAYPNMMIEKVVNHSLGTIWYVLEDENVRFSKVGETARLADTIRRDKETKLDTMVCSMILRNQMSAARPIQLPKSEDRGCLQECSGGGLRWDEMVRESFVEAARRNYPQALDS